jgi:hypothetical protein
VTVSAVSQAPTTKHPGEDLSGKAPRLNKQFSVGTRRRGNYPGVSLSEAVTENGEDLSGAKLLGPANPGPPKA